MSAKDAPGPRRLVAMFTHYGCVTNRFFPKSSHGVLTAADLKGLSIEPLSPYVEKLLIPRGIRGMNEWTSTMVRGQGNDPHTQVVGSFFTCQPVTPNSNDPFSFAQATKFNAMPVSASLDHIMAHQLSPEGKPFYLRVGGLTDTPMTGVSYSAAETQFQGFDNLTAAFRSLTGLFGGGQMNADTYQAVRGKSIIDLVRDDLETLERFDMSRADKLKLEAWKELLNQAGGVMASGQCRQDVAAMLGATQANVDGALQIATATDSDVLTGKVPGTNLDGADVYSTVAVLAAICNVNPVILLKYPASFIFKGLGLTVDSHSLSHRIGNSGNDIGCLPGVMDMLFKIDNYYAQKFYRLIDLLHSVSEGTGSALDNSAAIWFQEMSDGNQHNLNNLPIIQAGSAGGYFKTGWAVNVEDGSANLTNGNSDYACTVTTGMVNGGSNGNTGTDGKYANAPINKYYCNLMNALGVKAGPDGFPAMGGSEEVTHYGMYDKTEDFVGGGTKPPKINNPGAFNALKAGA